MHVAVRYGLEIPNRLKQFEINCLNVIYELISVHKQRLSLRGSYLSSKDVVLKSKNSKCQGGVGLAGGRSARCQPPPLLKTSQYTSETHQCISHIA